MTTLDQYLDGHVKDLVAASPRIMGAEEQERHRIYCLLLMAIVAFNWCGNKHGAVDTPAPDGEWGLNPLLPPSHTAAKRGSFLKRDYVGHNIAAFATDRDGNIIDFDFNHNEIFNSSIEHAEARLLNRLFKLTKIHDTWAIGSKDAGEKDDGRYGSMLKGVTVYTSLESCAQCSGIMTLGNVNEVVYLQEDPGQYKIGNIMYRLTAPQDLVGKPSAPRPVSADVFDFTPFRLLNTAFEAYLKKYGKPNMTSFLCTEAAYQIFLQAEHALADFKVVYKESPAGSRATRLNNEGVLVECLSFYQYVVDKGRRGTPH